MAELQSVFGRIEITQCAILLLSIAASVTDLIWGKIYNWLTIFGMTSGIFYFSIVFHWAGIEQSLMGVGIGLCLYGWMYGLGVLGAGDVKLLMALGAWGGIRYIEEVAILGIFVGGVMGLALLIVSGKLPGFYRRMRAFLLSIFIRELEFIPPRIDKSLRMPFGIPIAIAAVWVAFGHPF